MTRFLDDPHSPLSPRTNGHGPAVPSFLREMPEDRPDPTDLTLHFVPSGPSFSTVSSAAAPAPSAPARPEEALVSDASNQTWTPALAYKALSAAAPSEYKVEPDSYLAAVEALRPSEETGAVDADLAEPAGPAKEWDPLTDPWPLGRPGASLETTLLEAAARERVAPYGLMEYEPSAFRLPVLPDPEPAPGYAPVSFTPAPYVDEDVAGMTQPFDMLEHPSGPLPRHGNWPPTAGVPESPAALTSSEFSLPKAGPDSAYDVTLTGPLGSPDLGFSAGRWYSLAGEESRPVTVGDAVWSHPELAGQVVQVACWWMRENPKTDRALDLATEIALAVSDAVRGNRSPLVF
jgi:hypothetical protein